MAVAIGIIIIWIIWMLLTRKHRRLNSLVRSMAILARTKGGYMTLSMPCDEARDLLIEFPTEIHVYTNYFTSLDGKHLEAYEFRYKGMEFSLTSMDNSPIFPKTKLMVLPDGTIKYLEKDAGKMDYDAPHMDYHSRETNISPLTSLPRRKSKPTTNSTTKKD